MRYGNPPDRIFSPKIGFLKRLVSDALMSSLTVAVAWPARLSGVIRT